METNVSNYHGLLRHIMFNDGRYDEGFGAFRYPNIHELRMGADRSAIAIAPPVWAVQRYWPLFETTQFKPPWPVVDTSQDVDGRTEAALLDEHYGDPMPDQYGRLASAPIIRPKIYEAFVSKAVPHLQRLEEAANEFLRRFLPGSFELYAASGSFSDVRRGRLIAWNALDTESGADVPIGWLSASQQRWARLAVEYAISNELVPSGVGLVLVDEPELALHRANAQRVANGFAEFAQSTGLPVILSSHSAPFIDQRGSHLVHVHRNRYGVTAADPVECTSLEELTALLELSPSEVLQLVKTFVLVEGEHDKAVLEAFIGAELSSSRAVIIPMRGTRNLNESIEADLMFRYTAADVLIVLDAIGNADLIAEKWTQIRTGGLTAVGAKAVLADVRSKLRDPTDEESRLLGFARVAVDSGLHERIQLFGFEKRDIIEYLPPAAFGLSDEWSDLYDAYRMAYRGKQRTMSFKEWLNSTKGAGISTNSIRNAAQELSSAGISPEFASLLNLAKSDS
jgi:hypothetical protein